MAPPSSLPNVHISTHPCVKAKLSQLRSSTTNARETKALIHEITLMLGTEALASCLTTKETGTAETPLGYAYTTITTTPSVVLVPILRSGLGMIDALQLLLPDPVAVHHLGLFREATTLSPVEYYNNLPYHSTPPHPTPSPSITTSTQNSLPSSNPPIPTLAILLDPVIATGATSTAAIQTLLEWGVSKVILISILASEAGIAHSSSAAGTQSGGGVHGGGGGGGGREKVEIWVAGVDDGGLDSRGMIVPGLGDVGDRLFMTVGK